ncbi:MAG: hypothetical protein AAFQ87_28530, partial [Bacteroidota bacterium]
MTLTTIFNGDVVGLSSSLSVQRIQGNDVTANTPSFGQILKWNGTTWDLALDDNTTYTAGTGISISGTTITNTGDTDASDDITTSSNAGGDVTGQFSNLTVGAIQGNAISTTAPSNDQILRWNSTSSAWEPSSDDNTTYSAGTGLSLSGTTFTNTGDTDASDDITTSSNAGGDVSGQFASLTVDGIQGNPVAGGIPALGQVLKWDGTQW